jgi:hypothetical protein
MNKTLKKFAIAILATGATVAATSSQAVDTNTFTNVIQTITVNLTVYSNAPFKSTILQTGEKPVAITTKSIISALSNASSVIPALSGFDFGRSPQLVLNTTFQSTNSPVYSTNDLITNSGALNTTNGDTVYFSNALAGTSLTITTNISALFTNIGTTNGNTNAYVLLGVTNVIPTNTIAYSNSVGGTNTITFTNTFGVFSVLTAVSNAGATNISLVTYSNFVSGTATNYVTNFSGISVQGGTAASPVFADVSSYLSRSGGESSVITATGTNLEGTQGGSNGVIYIQTETANSIRSYGIRVFGTTGTAVGDNLDLGLQGFSKDMYKYDILHAVSKHYTNEVSETTSTTAVSGSGYIGGTYVTNSLGASNNINLFDTEYTGIGSITNTNTVSGSITNPVPVVVVGTISVAAPHSVPQ